MPLFGSKPKEPLDAKLLEILHPDTGHTRSALGQLQPSIQQSLLDGEWVLAIAIQRLGWGPAVVTNNRLLVFSGTKQAVVRHSLGGSGLSVQLDSPPTSVGEWGVTVRHPEVHGPDPSDNYLKWTFRNKADASALFNAIDAVRITAE